MIYHVKPTTGNDANDGQSSATAKKTIGNLVSTVTFVSGDRVYLYDEADHVISSSIIPTSGASTIWESAPTNTSLAKITGTGFFGLNNSTTRIKKLQISTSVATGMVNSTNSGSRAIIEDCILDATGTGSHWISGTGSALSVFNTKFINAERTLGNCLVGAVGSTFFNCSFDGIPKSSAITSNSYSLIADQVFNFLGCTFKNIPTISFHNTANPAGSMASSFSFCTFDGTDARGAGLKGYFNTYRQASNANYDATTKITNCIFYNYEQMMHAPLAGVLVLDSIYVKNNWISSTTDLTNYNSLGGDITNQTNPMFYNDGNTAYRIEASSSASPENNGVNEVMGAFELEKPSVWFTSLPPAEVKDRVPYRVLSRSDNEEGEFSGGGETNPDKVLTTSEIIVGNYIPIEADNVRKDVIFGLSETGAVSVPAREDVREGVEVDQSTGLLDVFAEANLPVDSDVRKDVVFGDGSEGTCAVPEAADVRKDVAVDNTTGDLDVEAEANLPQESEVLEGVEFGPDNKYTGTVHVDPVIVDPSIVVYPEQYTDSEGTKTGTAGYVDESNADIAKQLEQKLTELAETTLPDYEKMRFVLDPLKNDFYRNAKQFGVRVDNSYDDKKYLNTDVQAYYFRLVLSNDYIPHEDDVDARNAGLELISKAEVLRRKIKATRAGTFNAGNLIWELDWRVDAPAYYDTDKIVILQAYFTLKAKNTYIP